MQPGSEHYKNLFYHHLKPFLEMLEHQQEGMDTREWGATVYRIASSVENHPDQYVGADLPNNEVTAQLIKEIFEDFMENHPLLTEKTLLVDQD